MPRRGKRTRIAPGIFSDKAGISIIVRAGSLTKEIRAPLGTSKDTLQILRATATAKLRGSSPQAARRGTLTSDIARYLALVQHLAGKDSIKAHLQAWVSICGMRPRSTLTRLDVLAIRGEWLEAGIAPKTINNRVSALRSLYLTLDGDDAITPADRVKPLPVHRSPAVAVPPQTILDVDAQLQRHEQKGWLRDRKTRARFRVLASTGVRASELMRAERPDVDLVRRVWTVRDGKGGFRPGIYLTADMLAAWRLYIASDAWGWFDTYSLARVLRNAGWPADVRPYQLRHSIGIALSEAGVDLADVQQVMGHKHQATTRRHYVPVLASRLQRASEQLAGRLPWPTIVEPRIARTAQKKKSGGLG